MVNSSSVFKVRKEKNEKKKLNKIILRGEKSSGIKYGKMERLNVTRMSARKWERRNSRLTNHNSINDCGIASMTDIS